VVEPQFRRQPTLLQPAPGGANSEQGWLSPKFVVNPPCSQRSKLGAGRLSLNTALTCCKRDTLFKITCDKLSHLDKKFIANLPRLYEFPTISRQYADSYRQSRSWKINGLHAPRPHLSANEVDFEFAPPILTVRADRGKSMG